MVWFPTLPTTIAASVSLVIQLSNPPGMNVPDPGGDSIGGFFTLRRYPLAFLLSDHWITIVLFVGLSLYSDIFGRFVMENYPGTLVVPKMVLSEYWT